MKAFLLFLAFQTGWFACVLGAANDLAWLGPVGVASALSIALIVTKNRIRQVLIVLALALFGTIMESVLLTFGLISFKTPPLIHGLCPLWMTALWANMIFALDFFVSWFGRRRLLAALCGAIAGPLTYQGGASLGALTLEPLSLWILGVLWAIYLPMLVFFYQAFGGDSRELAVSKNYS